jgi:hypothetical protein
MSYDLFCYRAASGVPDAAEAQALIDTFLSAEEASVARAASCETRDRITAALIECNPLLEPFKFDYRKIAESDGISEEEARSRYQHVELNPPEGDLAIQLEVHDDHVFITIPYWYQGNEADRVFSQCSKYLQVIRKAVGFLAYDPQTDTAFDPQTTGQLDYKGYEETVKGLPKIVAEATKAGKPWWQFW